MSNTTFKVFVDKLGGVNADEYIGSEGDLFYDQSTGELRVSNGQTPGGTSVSGGIPLSTNEGEGEGGYRLQLADNGKLLFLSSATIRVPRNLEVAFPIGATITIASGDNSVYIYYVNDYPDENGTATIYGVGFANPSVWSIPQRSLATLIKVDTDTWYVSGYGLQDDD